MGSNKPWVGDRCIILLARCSYCIHHRDRAARSRDLRKDPPSHGQPSSQQFWAFNYKSGNSDRVGPWGCDIRGSSALKHSRVNEVDLKVRGWLGTESFRWAGRGARNGSSSDGQVDLRRTTRTLLGEEICQVKRICLMVGSPFQRCWEQQGRHHWHLLQLSLRPWVSEGLFPPHLRGESGTGFSIKETGIAASSGYGQSGDGLCIQTHCLVRWREQVWGHSKSALPDTWE